MAYNDRLYVTTINHPAVSIYSPTGESINNFGPEGITTYKDKFYITDTGLDKKVFIYDNTGIYENNFNLHDDNDNPQGITVDNNNFYIVNITPNKVYTYNNTGNLSK